MGPTRRNMPGGSAALLAAGAAPRCGMPQAGVQAGAQTPMPDGPHSLPPLPRAGPPAVPVEHAARRTRQGA